MKIVRLRLAGFGPYRAEQEIDFERFDDDGIFLITGKTGAGKSSILDAICYAIYDTVPRYDKVQSQLRSDYCEPGDASFVELEFTLGDDRYRVRRSPKFDRPKQRGEGVTTAQATAELFIRESDGWRGLAARSVDVGHEIARILPLSADQFLQVMLLAQNRFQQFLLAKTDDRRAVLRTLFGSVRFEQLEKSLGERNKELTEQLSGAQQHIERLTTEADRVNQATNPSADQDELLRSSSGAAEVVGSVPWFMGVLSAATEEREVSKMEVERITKSLAEATSAARSADEIYARQQRRLSASTRLTELEGNIVWVTAMRCELETAARALRAAPLIDGFNAAGREARAAAPVLSLALSEWNSKQASEVDPGRDGIRSIIDALLIERGALAEILLDECRLPEVEVEILRLGKLAAVTSSRLERHREDLDGIPALLEALAAGITIAASRAAALEPARDSEQRIRSALRAALTAEQLEHSRMAALAAQKLASSANAAAASAYDELLDRRLVGHAFELAAALRPGKPCSVCGSTSHPHPATSDAAAVSEADIQTAHELRVLSNAQLSITDTEVHRITAEIARSRGQAGDATPEALTIELDAATASIRDAVAAASERSELELKQIGLIARRDAAESQTPILIEKHEAAHSALAENHADATALKSRIAAHLDTFVSIQARVSFIDTRVAGARALSDALERVESAQKNLATAGEALRLLLAELGFADQSQPEAARRSTLETGALERRIREHDDATAAAKSTLAEPDLQDLPVDTIELEPSRVALHSAHNDRDEALARHSEIEARLLRLRDLATEAADLLRTSAELVSQQTQVRELAELVAGKGSNTRRIRLETYVLAARLEQIIVSANLRLETMTTGRYRLELDDAKQYRDVETGLGLSIRDSHTGLARATYSLSGGETFLASLALALGLAEVVSNQAGGIALDTLFVDEGFGSLDSETLDIAMTTLDGLRAGGRTVGLISHVDSMREQIPAKLRITVEPGGGSRVDYRMDTA